MLNANRELMPEGEDARMAAVRSYDILDTPPDGAFDRVTALAARHFGVPIAIVSIVDRDRIWFKSRHGVDVDEIGRDPGLCASAILQDGPWVVEDAAVDPRTLANPLVASEFGLRFYAGIPLRTRDGHNLGTLCLLDREPRTLTDDETATLADLAGIVMDQLELRLNARTVVEQANELRVQAEQTARALQESLLPPALPPIAGLDVAALYRPADAGEVGGDFYDVFGLPSGGSALVIGDVSGKGPRAAGVTALARHTIRAAALTLAGPADVLETLNRAMLRAQSDGQLDHYCTVHVSFLEAGGDGFVVRSASAGHPRALHARGDGSPRAVEQSGPPVGWIPDVSFMTSEITLERGDVVLIYTDGLSEARRGDRFLGEDALIAVLEAARGESAEAIGKRLGDLLASPGVDVRDDAAALVLRAV